MRFPVDFLSGASQEELQRSAEDYITTLLYADPDAPDSITLPDSTQVLINISSVGLVPLYGSSDQQKVLALFRPTEPFTAVALYLRNRWWTISDILKTEDADRVGVVEVQSVGERIVLYCLNRVMYRAKDMSAEELPFLCHRETDFAKILWRQGEAVGFYSVKASGSLWSSFSTRSYQLPVMDSIYVRKCHRGNGYGLQMLKDYVLSFKDSCLGLRSPLATGMYKVCHKYLSQYPGDAGLLWEVQSIGGPNQRTNIANKIRVMDLSAVSHRLMSTEEEEEEKEEEDKGKETTTIIQEADSVKCTVDIVEEVTIIRAAKEAGDVAVAAWGRSDGSGRWKRGGNVTEEKVIRIEDIEAESPGKDQVSEHQMTEEHSTSEQQDMLSVTIEGNIEAGKDSASMLDKTATVQASEDLESESTVAPAAEECHGEGLHGLCDSQIAIENVVSEIEEAHKKESTVVSGEVLDVCKEVEMVEMQWGAKDEAREEGLDEILTQQAKGQSTAAENEGMIFTTAGASEKQYKISTLAQEELAPQEDCTVQNTQQSSPLPENNEGLIPDQDEPPLVQRRGRRSSTIRTINFPGHNRVRQTEEQCNEAEMTPEKTEGTAKEKTVEGGEVSFDPDAELRQEKGVVGEENMEQNTIKRQSVAISENVSEKVVDVSGKVPQDGEDVEEKTSGQENVADQTTASDDSKGGAPENQKETAADSTSVKTSEDDKMLTVEAQQSETVALQLADLPRLSVVLVDLKKSQHGVQAGGGAEPAQDGTTLETSVPAHTQPKTQKKETQDIQEEKMDGKEESEWTTQKEDKDPEVEMEMVQSVVEDSVPEQSVSKDTVKGTAADIPEEGNTATKEIPQVAGISKEKQEEKTEGSGKVDVPTQEEDTKETDGEIEKPTIMGEESFPKQGPVKETPAIQSVVDLPTTEEKTATDEEETPVLAGRVLRSGRKTVKATQDDQDTEEDKSTEEVDLEKETRVLRRGRKSTSVTTRRKSKRVRTQPQTEEKEETEDPAPSEETPVEETTAEEMQENEETECTSQKEDKDPEADMEIVQSVVEVSVPEQIVSKDTVKGTAADENLDNIQTTDEVEAADEEEPAAETTVLESDQKTMGATQEEEDEEEKDTEEGKPVIVTRVLRSGQKCVVTISPRTSKRTVTQSQTEEEEGEGGTATMEKMQLEESISTERQDDNEEMAEDSEKVVAATQKEDKESETEMEKEDVAEESQESEQVTVEETTPPQSVEDIPTTEEENTIHMPDTDEDKSSEVDEPAKEIRVLRRGRKSASATPRRKSKRARKQLESEEEDIQEEGNTPTKQIPPEGGISEEKQEEKTEGSGKVDSPTQEEDTKETNGEIEKQTTVAEESFPKQGPLKETPTIQSVVDLPTTEEAMATDEEETPVLAGRVLRSGRKTMKATQDDQDTEEDKSTEEDELEKETRVLRRGRKSASATPRRKSKRVRTQPQTEEKGETEDPGPSEYIHVEEIIAKETQDNQEEKTEEKEENEFMTKKENNQDSETEVENKETVSEESHSDENTEEETPSAQGLEDLPEEENPTTEEDTPMFETTVPRSCQKNLEGRQDDQDTEQDKTTDEEELQKETRVLRGGRKSASATPRRKSKRARKQFETEEEGIPEEDNTPTKQIPPEGGISKEKQEEKTEGSGKVDVPTQEEDTKETDGEIEKQTIMAEESFPKQDPVKETPAILSVLDIPTTEDATATDEDETPVLAGRVLRSGRKTVKAAQDDQDTEEDTATPRRKSKRVRTQPQTEEKGETEDPAPSEETPVEETTAEETQEEKMQENEESECTSQKEDKDPEADMEIVQSVVEVSVPEQIVSKDTFKGTAADENLDNIQTTDEVEAADEEEPAAETTVLESDQKTMRATQEEEDEEEKDTEDGKPVIVTRVLRSGQKCVVTISPRTSKRTVTQSQTEEEEGEGGTATMEKMQLEESISTQRQDDKEEMTEDSEKADATQSVEDLPTKEQITDTKEDKSTEEEDPGKETRALRGGRKSASATPRRKSKREGKQPRTEEKEETQVDPEEEMETMSLNQEEEDEQSFSEDEQIVIGGKALRGRLVPSIIITPTSRRLSTKIHRATESSSDEESEHKAKRSSRKRTSSERTPKRRSKRHRI